MLTNYSEAIGTCGRMFHECPSDQFVDSLAPMLIYSQAKLCKPGQFIHYDHGTVSYHELGRQELCERAIGDWLFMTDTDHCFAPDLLERLLTIKKKHKARVISGLYLQKYKPHKPVAHLWGPNDTMVPLKPADLDNEILECGYCGGGVLLFDIDVIREIEGSLGQHAFDKIPGLSEDYAFFHRCRQLGIKTYLAPKVESHHLTQRMALHAENFKING